ncbi:putative C6 transcription factor [Aspergillus rambellii]|uniref:Xylanolytic transcriptional activator xlnR n=1 Tax=Aspergillus rambellii TaxID=308745 RepID=A0A0F8WZ49_9EURO|nr:putative C6 transcription factor [Aspergillus rambellii]
MTQTQTIGLDTLAEGSQYVLDQLQLSREPASGDTSVPGLRHSLSKSKDRLYNANDFKSPTMRDSLADARSMIRKNSSAAPIRRRISRACDQCNQLRTKCDGQNPCAHCIEFGLTCEYARERKKRGKASKKDLAAAAAAVGSGPGQQLNSTADKEDASPQDSGPSQEPSGRYDPLESSRSLSTSVQSQMPHANPMNGIQSGHPTPAALDALHLNQFSHLNDSNRPQISVPDLQSLQILPTNTNPRSPPSALPPQGLHGAYGDSAFSLINSQEPNPSSINQFRLGTSAENPSAPFLGLSPPAQSPGWLPLPSPSPANFPSFSMAPFSSSLRYPVLHPVLPHISSIIPQSLACDLLDGYFTSSSSSHLSPQSPYVVGYIFRKQSFLHPAKPRVCSPGLLASMLWVAAQTSDAPFLTSPPSARGRVCQKLLELTIGLLRPLIHRPALGEASPNYAANMVINGVALGGFGVSMDQLGAQSTATGAVDDVATYVHLATVISASEYKAASMRWWTAAWALARELKLGRELPPNTSRSGQDGDRDGDMDADPTKRNSQSMHGPGNSSINVTEEEREERRRLWWLLYATDRHLALCYNRPLTLLDKECSQLLQPMNDDLWQVGDFSASKYRSVGPPVECTGHSMFGYFLPLMTILGAIIDLQHARDHPRYGLSFRNGTEWEQQTLEITQQLDAYDRSLKDFETRYTSSLALGENEPLENSHLDHMVVAYGTHIMHVLYILLAGKWDPINLLEDHDMWISSESFIAAMSHAVGAAEAAAEILEYDPDLSFMPFFFGIYLLQGSFLLLLAADKLQADASPSVVRACETIVRAHEACVVTLNTEYQRTFRKVMRSALAQVRGRVPEDYGEQQQRRREVLSLYRWTGDGSGLAL